jgi:hypothetical protein
MISSRAGVTGRFVLASEDAEEQAAVVKHVVIAMTHVSVARARRARCRDVTRRA